MNTTHLTQHQQLALLVLMQREQDRLNNHRRKLYEVFAWDQDYLAGLAKNWQRLAFEQEAQPLQEALEQLIQASQTVDEPWQELQSVIYQINQYERLCWIRVHSQLSGLASLVNRFGLVHKPSRQSFKLFYESQGKMKPEEQSNLLKSLVARLPDAQAKRTHQQWGNKSVALV